MAESSGEPLLSTERLVLRPFRVGDERAMEHVFGDAEVMHFGEGVRDEAWIRAWVADQAASAATAPGRGLWAVVPRAHEEPIGYCGLTWFDELGGQPEVELGYRLARAQWGRGLATEAARAVRDHALDAFGLSRLVCLVDPGNTASVRVAEKLGMAFEKEVMCPGYTHPDHLYVLAARDTALSRSTID